MLDSRDSFSENLMSLVSTSIEVGTPLKGYPLSRGKADFKGRLEAFTFSVAINTVNHLRQKEEDQKPQDRPPVPQS